MSQVKFLGLTSAAVIGGAAGPENHVADSKNSLAVFEMDGFGESNLHSTLHTMETSGNAVSGGKVTVQAAVSAIGTVKPSYVSPTVQAAAAAADEYIAASSAGSVGLGQAASIALHFAQNDHLLQGTAGDIANVVAGVLSYALGKH